MSDRPASGGGGRAVARYGRRSDRWGSRTHHSADAGLGGPPGGLEAVARDAQGRTEAASGGLDTDVAGQSASDSRSPDCQSTSRWPGSGHRGCGDMGIGTAEAIAPETPAGSLRAMSEACREWGTYG